MGHLGNNAACRRRIGASNYLVHLSDAKALNDLFLLFRIADHAPVVLDLDLSAIAFFSFLCHFLNQLLDLLSTKPRHLDRVLHPKQTVKGRTNNIVRVV